MHSLGESRILLTDIPFIVKMLHSITLGLIKIFSFRLFSPYLFGGVTSFTKQNFLKVNGYPNKYYGWGAEDDDMYRRYQLFLLIVVRARIF